MAPKLPDQPGTGSNQDEDASMMFSEREFNENMSVRSKYSIEFSTDLNGQGWLPTLELKQNRLPVNL